MTNNTKLFFEIIAPKNNDELATVIYKNINNEENKMTDNTKLTKNEADQIIRENELNEMTRLHKLYLENHPEGVKINLSDLDIQNIQRFRLLKDIAKK